MSEAEASQLQVDRPSFDYGEVDPLQITRDDLDSYGNSRGVIERASTVDPSRIGSVSELSSRTTALAIALGDITHRGEPLGVADQKKNEPFASQGIQTITLRDTSGGRIVITTHNDYRAIHVVDDTRTASDGKGSPFVTLSVIIPSRRGSSAFRATREGESDIAFGRVADEGTVQKFVGVVREIAGRVIDALPREEDIEMFLRDKGWTGGGRDFPNAAGGGDERPPLPPPPGGSGTKEPEKVRELVPVRARRAAQEAPLPGRK